MKTILLTLNLFLFGLVNLHAQTMFSYQDAKGKAMSQAQVDQLDKKYQGFLHMEIIEDGQPLLVQVSPPSAEEMKTLKKLRDEETAALVKKWLGKALPPFSFKTLDGKSLAPKNLLGHPTLLFFWSKSDYNSVNQLAAMNQMVKSFKGKPVQFWAITFEDQVLVKEFLKSHPLAFTQMPGNFEFVMQKMGIMQTPVSMILDSKGIIRFLTTSTQKNIHQTLTQQIAKFH
jgi:peroxiredoxin